MCVGAQENKVQIIQQSEVQVTSPFICLGHNKHKPTWHDPQFLDPCSMIQDTFSGIEARCRKGHGTRKKGGVHPSLTVTPKEKGCTPGKVEGRGVPHRHTRRRGTVAVGCGPFTQLQHGVGGVEWARNVVRSELAPPAAHSLKGTKIERERERERQKRHNGNTEGGGGDLIKKQTEQTEGGGGQQAVGQKAASRANLIFFAMLFCGTRFCGGQKSNSQKLNPFCNFF